MRDGQSGLECGGASPPLLFGLFFRLVWSAAVLLRRFCFFCFSSGLEYALAAPDGKTKAAQMYRRTPDQTANVPATTG
jgi:hypothetical protein